MPPRSVARRRLVNSAVTTSAWIAAAIGIFVMGWIVVTVVVRGIGAWNLAFFTQLPPTANRRRRRPGQLHHRHPRDHLRRGDRRLAAGLLRGDLPVRVRPRRPRGDRHPRGHQHRAGRAVDHRRHVRLRHPRAAQPPLLGVRGLGRAGLHHAARHDADRRGHPQPGAQRAARVGSGHGGAALAGDARRGRQGGPRRPDHGRHPGRRPGGRRDRAAAVHGPEQPVLDERAVRLVGLLRRSHGQPHQDDLRLLHATPTRT